MRLICPNCDAQYEVPDDVIPAEGRDVQCSNCGDTWFQAHPDALLPAEEDEAPEQSTADEDPQDLAEEDGEDVETFEEVEPPEVSFENPDDLEPDLNGSDWDLEDEIAQDADDETGEDQPDEAFDAQADDAEEADVAPVEPEKQEPEPPRRRQLDSSVTDVLREEAAHEAKLRSEEQQSLETQSELALSAPATAASRRANEARDRMRELRGASQEEARRSSEATEIRDSRRDLLPDIEETNSTLRHGGEPTRVAETPEAGAANAKRGRGFRIGFVLVVLVAAVGVFVYGQHENLSASYPQYAPQIERFVDSADSARIWLDTKVTNLFVWLNGFVGDQPQG